MPKFNVAVSRRVFANVVIEAANEQSARQVARDRYRFYLLPTSIPDWVWCDHGTFEAAAEFAVDHVEELK